MREGKAEHARQADQSTNPSLILRTNGVVVSVPHYAEGKPVSLKEAAHQPRQHCTPSEAQEGNSGGLHKSHVSVSSQPRSRSIGVQSLSAIALKPQGPAGDDVGGGGVDNKARGAGVSRQTAPGPGPVSSPAATARAPKWASEEETFPQLLQPRETLVRLYFPCSY